MKKLFLLCTAVCCLYACTAGLKSAVKEGAIAPAFNDTLLDSNYLWVRGFGAAISEAAIAHAYQRAAEVLYGANLEANVQVVDAVSSGSTIDTSAQGVISQMELVSTEYMDDGGCAVIMRLDRKRLQAAGINLEGK